MGHSLYVQVDLFFYREPEEAKQQEEEEPAAIADYGIEYSAAPLAADQWPVQGADTQWSTEVPPPVVPGTWGSEAGRTKLLSYTLAC